MSPPYDAQIKYQELEQAFSPSAPISAKQFFAGRSSEIDAVVDSINERGQHVIVYGERGVGKTSFSNIIGSDLTGVFPVKVTCNRSDSFKGLWEKAFAKVRFERTRAGMGFIPAENREPYQLDLFLPDKENISSLDIQLVLEEVKLNLLFIFDEYDSIIDSDVKARMADTVKSLSDNAPRVTIMLVGIAENVPELIGSHLSIERCIRQVKMPRMSSRELESIIGRGLEYLNFTMDPKIRDQIVNLSLGFPHFTHLLAKQACRAAIEDNALAVSHGHYRRALTGAVSRVDESIRLTYQQATFSTGDKSNFETVLWACANSNLDEHGTFRTKDAVKEFERITKKPTRPESLTYTIGKLCTKERAGVLERIQSGKYVRFKFKNPLFRAYARMKFEAVMRPHDLKTSGINREE